MKASFIERLQKDKRTQQIAMAIGLVVVLIILVVICVSCSKKKDDDVVSANTVGTVSEQSVAGGLLVAPPEGMTQSTNEGIVNLINNYYNALNDGNVDVVAAIKKETTAEEKIRVAAKAPDIESYGDLLIYDYPGVNPGEYIVLIYSETKYAGIDTKAPGLQSTYITTAEDGTLMIDSNVDQATMDYVEATVSDPTIKDYFERVLVAYTDAIASDASLKTYMDTLSQRMDEAVVNAVANGQATDEQPAPTAEESAQTVNETVQTTDVVNLRASDSETADKLAKLELGATLTRLETRENGWSKVRYNEQEGFVKTEYLTVIGTNDAPAETPAETPADEGNNSVTGKVVIKESVVIRSGASTDSSKLATAFKGETYDLYMKQADGWCKINYNGQVAYVKTDYVDVQ